MQVGLGLLLGGWSLREGEERMKYNLIVDGKPNTLIEPWPHYHCCSVGTSVKI